MRSLIISSLCTKRMTDYLLQLHDDVLINIGEYVGTIYGPETYTRLGLTCQRMMRLLLPNDDASAQTIPNIILSRMEYVKAQRSMPQETTQSNVKIKSLRELAVFEAWSETPLCKDNRIPFEFASVDINESMHDKELKLALISESLVGHTCSIGGVARQR